MLEERGGYRFSCRSDQRASKCEILPYFFTGILLSLPLQPPGGARLTMTPTSRRGGRSGREGAGLTSLQCRCLRLDRASLFMPYLMLSCGSELRFVLGQINCACFIRKPSKLTLGSKKESLRGVWMLHASTTCLRLGPLIRTARSGRWGRTR